MKLQRCQLGEVKHPSEFNFGTGQNGDGIYCFKAGNKPMKEYYSKNGETLHTFSIDDKYVKDLSKEKLDFWEAKAFIYNNPQYKAFIFSHKGYGIPTSKEILITDYTIIKL